MTAGLTRPYDADTQNWRVADLNGDGKSDLVHIRSEPGTGIHLHAFLSAGDSLWQEQDGDIASTVAGSQQANWCVLDANGDGRSDLVYLQVGADTSQNPTLAVTTLLNLGSGDINQIPAFSEVTESHSLPSANEFGWLWGAADLNHDGNMDLYAIRPGDGGGLPAIDVLTSQAATDQVGQVDNGIGAVAGVAYGTSANWQ